MMNQELMAFWRQDIYPFFMWGNIVSFRGDGCVFIKEVGCWLKPAIILPASDGKELAEHLLQLKIGMLNGVNKLNVTYRNKLVFVLSNYNITISDDV